MAAFTKNEVGSTEDVVILSIVQEELQNKAVVRPTVMDMSARASKGVKELEIPKFSAAFSGPAAQNADGETPVAFQTFSLDSDTLVLDQWKNLPYRLTDRINVQNVVELEAEAAKSAGQKMATDLDSAILTEMATALQTEEYGTNLGDSAITLANINNARATLKKQNVTDLGGELFLLISVEQEKNMLNIDNFISADKYGARDALLSGEIGRVYGVRVVVSNELADDEAYMYHRSSVAFAAQQEINFEKQRADVRIGAWDYSFKVGYGVKMLDGGKRIVKFIVHT